jgi:ABC-2 type transport system permease protein
MLLRPRSTAFQVSAQALQLMRFGRLAQGAIILAWAAGALGLEWSAARLALAAFAILGGLCLFYGLFVLQATVSFWTTETLELMNTMTYGGTEAAQFPITVYKAWFRRFFTYVVPLACVTYFPVLAILGRDDPLLASPTWFRWAAPLVGVLFLAACLQVWQYGVRHYRSTGS